MQLHRVLNPEWRFADTTTYLLAEIATIESSRRLLEALRFWDVDEVPEEYWPATYGPRGITGDPVAPDSAAATADDAARAAAADIAAMNAA